MSRTVLAIDIGSTKICAIIAEMADDNTIAITGAGISQSTRTKEQQILNLLPNRSKLLLEMQKGYLEVR